MSKYLASIDGPKDLAELTYPQLTELSAEIRDFLIEKVSKSGGHLGPNLGVVELTIAIHRTFESPKDTVIFDTGHQSYVHKLLTGRAPGFDKLRNVVASLVTQIVARASTMLLKIHMPQPR